MDDKTRRNTGGAPPKVDEEVLRDRYGEPGVTLVRLLYRLRSEGRFTNKDAARRWVDSDPDSSVGIVSQHTDDGPVIRENRLSDLMAMKNGRVPRGLVHAFFDLWAEQAGRSSAEVRALADEINVVYKSVAHEPKATSLSSGRRNTKDAEIVRLKDELLSVQHQLVEATKNEHRFRNLVFVLIIALNQLQQQHDHLTLERDELLTQAGAAELANQEAQAAAEQLIRARSQLTETEDRLHEATGLVKELQHRYAHLLTQLTSLGSPASPSPPSGSSADAPALPGWSTGSIEEHERILDRIDQELQEGTQRLEQTRRDAARTTAPVTHEPHIVDSQVLHNSETEYPENPATWEFGPTGTKNPLPFAPVPQQEPAFPRQDPNYSVWSTAHPDAAADNTHSRHKPLIAYAPNDQQPPAIFPTLANPPSPSSLVTGIKRQPQSGWRKAVYRASGGLINVGEGPDVQSRREFIARVNQPLFGCYKIAILSLKGGVGKTTVTAAVGSTFASLRGDRVIAVDTAPDRGTLSQKIPLETTATVRHLLRDANIIKRYSDIRAYTSQGPSRLEVLASEQDPAVLQAFSEDDYRRTVALLRHFYNIVLTDCGTGLMHSAMKGVLDLADTLVVVSSGSVDGARSASATLDWLDAHGYRDLVARSVAVINSVRPRAGSVDLDKLAQHFGARCRAVCRIPFDPHLEEGAEIELDHLGTPTRLALLELAAVLADDFINYPRYGGYGQARPR